MRVPLITKEHPGWALKQYALAELRAASTCLTGRKPDAVHQARKHLKKTRATLRLLRGAKPSAVRHDALATLRRIARNLSAQRDRQVVVGLSEEWRVTAVEIAERRAATALLGALKPHPVGTVQGQSLQDVRTRLRGAEACLERWPLDDFTWSHLTRGLKRSQRRMRRAERHFTRSQRADDLHEWRKRSKDIWYQTRLLRPWLRRRSRELPSRLRTLTELQGRTHDLELIRRTVARLRSRLATKQAASLRQLIRQKRMELLSRVAKAAQDTDERMADELLRSARRVAPDAR